MAQDSTGKSPQQKEIKPKPDGKIVVSSVVTRSSLVAAISDRNPIIASRTKSGGSDL